MIKEIIENLVSISDKDYGYYAFSKDPLNGKVDHTKEEMILDAILCGKEQAELLKSKYGLLKPAKYAELLGIEVIKDESLNDGKYIMFGKFNGPNKITIFVNNILEAKKVARDEDIVKHLGKTDLEDIVLSHEIFHYLESEDDSLYVNTKEIVLWSIGKFKYRSRLIALSEIAAMAFAKELLNLSFSPQLLDVLLLYPYGPEEAEKIYEEMLSWKERDRKCQK